ncbi:MAG: TonB-dependent receptor [Pseudomonadota bacterium]|nr:TonB-dependent receptor [Pseudomonadota bacterium]
MTEQRFRHLILLACTTFIGPTVAFAQTAPASSDPAVAPPPKAAPAGDRRIYTPADFARFSPKTAFDMVAQLPGFTIRGADQERGLGQASENVLINGERSANKSGGAIAELQKVSATNVERIELVEAAQLGIAGLSGQVANVIVKTAKKSSGQFEWRPEVRAHYASPNLLRGLVSYTGKTGPVDYTLSLENQAGRGAYGGPASISDPSGVIFERRTIDLHSDFDQPTLTGRFGIDAWGSSKGNLSIAWKPYFFDFESKERRERSDGNDRDRLTTQTQKGYIFDLNGDFDFAMGPGRLKLIGLRKFEHEPTITTQITDFDSGASNTGVKFDRDVRIGETIGRVEYGWKMGRGDWQVSLERAYNRLEQDGRLFVLDNDGEFAEQDFPEGKGIVDELRYEGLVTFSRPLTGKLDLQVVGGAERSRLDRVDGDLPPRTFVRPKGSLSLGWRPAKGWDANLKLRRRVGQISFYDFLAQPNLQQDRENAGNPDLVPPQSWEVEGEVGRDFGAWGKTRLKAYAHRIDDIIVIIPIGQTGEAIGNLPRATKLGIESKSTIQFDPIGWRGAKLDATIGFQKSRVRDPLTGEQRPISGTRDRWVNLSLRHDIPGSKLAWGASANHEHVNKTYFLTEVGRGWEGPWFASVYAEHKDVYGLTVRGTVGNVLNARHRFDRVVYSGFRDANPVAFVERHDQLIGPIFSLSVRGNF